MEEFKKLIEGNERAKLVLKLIQKNQKITLVFEDDEVSEFPSFDGQPGYIREGLTSTDINGRWYPDSLIVFLTGVKEWIEDGFEFIHHPKIWWDFMVSTNPFKLPWGGWVWTTGSLGGTKMDYVRRKMPRPKNTKDWSSLYEAKLKETSDEEVIKYLEEHSLLISPGIWVNRHDATVLTIDEKIHPFARKDGWSIDQQAEFIKTWVTLLDRPYPLEVIKPNN